MEQWADSTTAVLDDLASNEAVLLAIVDMDTEVTRADARDFVERTSTHVPGVLVDAVVSELDARLRLVGSHPTSTVLTAATVPQWIEIRVME